jgi:hypothetical protein
MRKLFEFYSASDIELWGRVSHQITLDLSHFAHQLVPIIGQEGRLKIMLKRN